MVSVVFVSFFKIRNSLRFLFLILNKYSLLYLILNLQLCILFLKGGPKNCINFRTHKIWIRPVSWSTKVIHHGYRTDESRFDSRREHHMSLLHSAGLALWHTHINWVPQVRRSERQTKQSRACSVVGRKYMNLWLGAVFAAAEAKCRAQLYVCTSWKARVLLHPAANPLPGSLPTEGQSATRLPPAQPSMLLQFHPKDHTTASQPSKCSSQPAPRNDWCKQTMS